MIEWEDIKKLAELSRLDLSTEEQQIFRADIDSILGYVAQIQKIELAGFPPEAGEVQTVLRKDEMPHESGIFTDRLLTAAPKREGQYVKVKKIL